MRKSIFFRQRISSGQELAFDKRYLDYRVHPDNLSVSEVVPTRLVRTTFRGRRRKVLLCYFLPVTQSPFQPLNSLCNRGDRFNQFSNLVMKLEEIEAMQKEKEIEDIHVHLQRKFNPPKPFTPHLLGQFTQVPTLYNLPSLLSLETDECRIEQG